MGGQLIWEEDPRESANVLTWKGKGWLTGWPHTHSAVVMQLQTIVPPLSSVFLSSCRCHVHTNKSAYLCADTKVTELDLSPGVHQHIGWFDICGDKLLDRTATQALHRHYLSTPIGHFPHLDEVFSGSTDMSGLWPPGDVDNYKLGILNIVSHV